MKTILTWDIYEITTKGSSIQGVMLRGRIRKFSLVNNITLLTENALDLENTVRFAIEHSEDPEKVISFVKTLISDSEVSLIKEDLPNPVLSKMTVNKEERYTI